MYKCSIYTSEYINLTAFRNDNLATLLKKPPKATKIPRHRLKKKKRVPLYGKLKRKENLAMKNGPEALEGPSNLLKMQWYRSHSTLTKSKFGS